MSVMAGSDIASVMLGPSYVNAVQGCKFQDICVSAKGGGATLALRNGFRPAAGAQRSRKARRAGENAHRARRGRSDTALRCFQHAPNWHSRAPAPVIDRTLRRQLARAFVFASHTKRDSSPRALTADAAQAPAWAGLARTIDETIKKRSNEQRLLLIPVIGAPLIVGKILVAH